MNWWEDGDRLHERLIRKFPRMERQKSLSWMGYDIGITR